MPIPAGAIIAAGSEGLGEFTYPMAAGTVLTSAGPDAPPTYEPPLPSIFTQPGYCVVLTLTEDSPETVFGAGVVGTWTRLYTGDLMIGGNALMVTAWRKDD